MGISWGFVGMLRDRVQSDDGHESCRRTVHIEVCPVLEPNRKSVVIMKSFGSGMFWMFAIYGLMVGTVTLLGRHC